MEETKTCMETRFHNDRGNWCLMGCFDDYIGCAWGFRQSESTIACGQRSIDLEGHISLSLANGIHWITGLSTTPQDYGSGA